MRTWGRSVYCFMFGLNQVYCFGLKPGARGEYLMYTVSAKNTELGGRLKYQQGATSSVWYWLSRVVGSLQISYIRDRAVSTAGSNRSGPRSIPKRAKHRSANSFEIVTFLLKTNDGRGGRPGWAMLSATYASAKTRERSGSISSHCLNGELLLTR